MRSSPTAATERKPWRSTDGLETAQAILEEYPDARIIMVSSLAYDDTFKEAEEIGAIGFIDKPFGREQLLEAFGKAVG